MLGNPNRTNGTRGPDYWQKHAVPQESFFIPPRLAEDIEDLLVASIEAQPKDYELTDFCIKFFQRKQDAQIAANRDTVSPDPERYSKDMIAVEMLKGREGEMSDPRSTFKAGKRIVDSAENNAMNTLNHPRDSLPHDERRSDASSVLHYEGQRAVGSLEKNALDAIREREVSWGTSVLNDEQNTDQTVGIKKTSTTGGKSDHLEISPGKKSKSKSLRNSETGPSYLNLCEDDEEESDAPQATTDPQKRPFSLPAEQNGFKKGSLQAPGTTTGSSNPNGRPSSLSIQQDQTKKTSLQSNTKESDSSIINQRPQSLSVQQDGQKKSGLQQPAEGNKGVHSDKERIPPRNAADDSIPDHYAAPVMPNDISRPSSPVFF